MQEIESKLALISRNIKGLEEILRCNFNIDNTSIKEKVNDLWVEHYWAEKALALERIYNDMGR